MVLRVVRARLREAQRQMDLPLAPDGPRAHVRGEPRGRRRQIADWTGRGPLTGHRPAPAAGRPFPAVRSPTRTGRHLKKRSIMSAQDIRRTPAEARYYGY